MSKYPLRYKNEPNRLESWNYSAPGRYSITICTYNREHLFGMIEKDKMILSEYGEIVRSEILKIPEYHKRAILDEWVVMPDHIHLLIELKNWDYDNGVSVIGETNSVGQIHEFALHRPQIPTPEQIKQYRAARRKMIVFKILGKMQMKISKQINILRNTPGKTNWQSDYYDHVIGDNDDYLRIKNYIIENPKNWIKK